RHVHGEIRRLAGRAAQHAVLVVARLLAELGRPEPERPLVLVGELARGELLQDLLGKVPVTYVALLRRPHVELDAVVAQDPSLLLDNPRDGIPPEVLEPLALGRALRARATLRPVGPGELDQVLARIAVLGERGGLAELLRDARLERARQRLELGARVVDVVLGGDLRPLRAQQTRERVADGGRARADDHERAGRVRGDELEPDAAAALTLAATVGVAHLKDLAEGTRAPRGRP